MKIVLPTLHVRDSAQAVGLAAGCLAAALPADEGFDARLLDFYPDTSMARCLEDILAEQPDLVAFPVYAWNRLQVCELAHHLKRARPELWLIAGGPEATGDPRGLSDAAPWSALVHGEGEQSFTALARALARGMTEPVAGATRCDAGAVTVFSSPAPVDDLATLPSPWLDGTLHPTPQGGVLWEVARGCAFACDYCFEARSHRTVRCFDRDRLTAELECFISWGVSQVWVLDSTFNYPPERGVALLELLLETAPGLHYHLEAKADYIDRQTAHLLGQLNCSVQLGLQSTREDVLRVVHRPLDLESLTEKIHLLAAEGVIYGFDLIYGLPGDDLTGFIASLDSVLTLAPNHLHLFPLALLPGTRLAEQRERFGLIAQADPPYELLRSSSWSEQELAQSRLLAAAIDIFYNTGRAVAFFPALLDCLDLTPCAFFQDLIDWALSQPEIDRDALLDTERWSAEDAYRLQQSYLSRTLQLAGKAHLTTAVLDLLCYHFHYAETLLTEELQPGPASLPEPTTLWQRPWRRAPRLRLVPFAYEVLDLAEIEGMPLEDFTTLFRPVGSTALFVRRGDEVFSESLDEDLLRLLTGCDGDRSPEEIFAGSLPRANGVELVAFAVQEGLLCALEE